MTSRIADSQCPVWQVSPRRALRLDRPHLLGILNVTPDSFSDGGQFSSEAEAVAAGVRMAEQGASIIDVGGESTRPGSQPVDAQEQIRRTALVIEGLARTFAGKESGVLISIDTTHAEVARAALDAGASIINDTSAGRDDPALLGLAASRRCGLILMHRLRPPKADVFSHQYASEPQYGDDVVHSVRDFLAERCEAAIAAGVCRESIVLDPGLGFGKSVAQNFELIRRWHEFGKLGFPLLSAASRKSFIGAATGQTDPAARVHGSVAVSVLHYIAGARLFRVHDVAAHRDALATAAAVCGMPQPFCGESNS